MQALAIARTLRGRGWRTAALLADFDVAGLSRKGLLDPELETIVFSTPPNSNEDVQVCRIFSAWQDSTSVPWWQGIHLNACQAAFHAPA
jgi:hypothetical protein